jgi:hypothetical protein
MSGTLIILAGLSGALAVAMPRARQPKAPDDTTRKPQKALTKLKLVGGKDVPLDEPYEGDWVLLRKPPLEPVASARQFAAWLRKYHVGKHSDRVLMGFYDEFCVILGVEPTPENMMRSELREMRGIRRVVESTTKNGKRHRPVAWFVEGPRVEHDPKAKKAKARKSA